MLTAYAREYPINGLESNPLVLNALLTSYDSSDSIWDFRPDPDRFSLREMAAHVADWDEVYIARLNRAVVEDRPKLESVDEDLLCVERDYAHQDPFDNLEKWKLNRGRLVALIRSLPNEAFTRTTFSFLGEISIDGWLARILGHDLYHIRQTIDFVALHADKVNARQ